MISKKACCPIFDGKMRMISLAVLSILLLNITTTTTLLVSDSNIALAQSRSGSSTSPSSNDIGGSNNTIANKIS